ncbi:MAG TPA: alkaline phosphatase family protein [Kofleriaceae bacterium]|nr:alkaline phosphatase family protein [Kofleriaceae bacterium]
MRFLVAAGLALLAILTTIALAGRARRWNDELAVAPLVVGEAPGPSVDPGTPRLTRRVLLIIVDGLGADEADLPYLDELRRRGVGAVAAVPYPTISRPNYVSILTGVPPRDSGVRVNRVDAPVAVDTVMDRVRAAGLSVATASDHGSLASLFLRNTRSISGVDWIERDTRVAPPPPTTWPFDEARRVDSLDALGPVIAELAAGPAALVPVLVLDVDRAGHVAGVGDEYRAVARAVDRMLRGALARVDLARDTVIITADHGHVAPGGHGGDERAVSEVPLVLAGSGIVPGAAAHDAGLIDIAPTVAALLGVPAPRHAEGRTLVEFLALPREGAARRSAIDEARRQSVAAIAAAARARQVRPAPVRLLVLATGLTLAALLARVVRRRGALVVTPASLWGALALAVIAVAIVVVTRGRMSPSYVPSLARTQQLGAVGVALAIVLQLIATERVARRARDQLATASGTALVGLGFALGTTGLSRAWFSPPHLEVPPPFWMVAVPALDLAAATCALATAIALALVLLRAIR